MSTFEVVRGPEGDCLLLDGTRIGGPDPGCGGVSWFVFRIEEACDVVPKDELDRLKAENARLWAAVEYLYGFAHTCGVDSDDMRELGIEVE
jgi:hypothetical protein